MATQRVLGAQVYDLLPFGCCQQKTRHLKIQRLSLVSRQYNRKPHEAALYSLWIYSIRRPTWRWRRRLCHHMPTHDHPGGYENSRRAWFCCCRTVRNVRKGVSSKLREIAGLLAGCSAMLSPLLRVSSCPSPPVSSTSRTPSLRVDLERGIRDPSWLPSPEMCPPHAVHSRSRP